MGIAVSKHVTSYSVATSDKASNHCVICKTEKHPLYSCIKFRALPQTSKMSILKSNDLCVNCLRPGHFVKQCKSVYRCKVCQRPHHSLLHVESRSEHSTVNCHSNESPPIVNPVMSHAVTELKTNALLMTCKLLIEAPNGSLVEARGILDSASSASFVSERIVQSLGINRSSCNATISGIAGLTHKSSTQSVATFNISPIHSPNQRINVSAIVVPRVTRDLPVSPISFNTKWSHLSAIQLADPTFGLPGRVDILLGVDVVSNVLLQGRRFGPSDSPVAFETLFGWVLAGRTGPQEISHEAVVTGDDLLRKFWEIEKSEISNTVLSLEEKLVLQHYKSNHYRTESGAFVVPLPKREDSKPLGESRSKAVRRFLSLERSLCPAGHKDEFDSVMNEYFELGHAEIVPHSDLEKPPEQVFYLPQLICL